MMNGREIDVPPDLEGDPRGRLWSRREVGRLAVAALAAPVALQVADSAVARGDAVRVSPASVTLAAVTAEDWRALDRLVQGWWDPDLRTMQEADLAVQTNALFEPFPYVPAGGNPGAFPFLFDWDTQFINRALIAHGRLDLVLGHILDHLQEIERFGRVLNYNVVRQQRSQPPLLPDSVRRYHTARPDLDLLWRAYPLLKREYQGYWLAPHHLTPTGLSTFRDLGRGDKQGAYFESGLDNTPVWGADVRDCVPLILNCALVKYAEDMAWLARLVRRDDDVAYWNQEGRRHTALIRQLCWNSQKGSFFEYDYVQGTQLPYWGVYAYWALWAGVATPGQARALVGNLDRFETAHGLTETDQAYPDPTGLDNLGWMYPLGWPPSQMNAVEGLDRYGFHDAAKRIARKYVDLEVAVQKAENTDYVWEKYDVVLGGPAGSPFHGWSAAAVAVLGRRAYGS